MRVGCQVILFLISEHWLASSTFYFILESQANEDEFQQQHWHASSVRAAEPTGI